MRFLTSMIVVYSIGCLSACGQHQLPTVPSPAPLPLPAPSNVPPSNVPPATSVPATIASLVIEELSVKIHANVGDGFGYEPRFLLRETSGTSGVTIENISVGVNGGWDNTGPGCWWDALRVPPGGTLDVFYTDSGATWLGYCAPGSSGRLRNPELLLIVAFIDDAGRTGTAYARVTGS